jgi:small nuclear ribonucleoprotein D3
MSIGVPIKILHEAEGHVVTIESVTSEVYRGKLIEAEDNMNCQLSNVTVTYRDGRQAQLEYIYVRGSKIRFMIFPDMLKVIKKEKILYEFHLFVLFRMHQCLKTCVV